MFFGLLVLVVLDHLLLKPIDKRNSVGKKEPPTSTLPVQSDPDQPLDSGDAAEFIGFSVNYLLTRARKDEIKGNKVGREWRFKQSDLQYWIDENK